MTVGWEREEGKTGAVKLTEGLSVLDREGVFYLGDGKEAQVHVYLREEYDIFAGAGRLRVRGGGERSGRPARGAQPLTFTPAPRAVSLGNCARTQPCAASEPRLPILPNYV